MTEVDSISGIFHVKGKDKQHTINFSVPSCTCKDWKTHHIPCKHFFAIFNLKESWDWDKLPATCLNSAYLNIDNDAITSHSNTKSTSSNTESQVDISKDDSSFSEPKTHSIPDNTEIMDTKEISVTSPAITGEFATLPVPKVISCM